MNDDVTHFMRINFTTQSSTIPRTVVSCLIRGVGITTTTLLTLASNTYAEGNDAQRNSTLSRSFGLGVLTGASFCLPIALALGICIARKIIPPDTRTVYLSLPNADEEPPFQMGDLPPDYDDVPPQPSTPPPSYEDAMTVFLESSV